MEARAGATRSWNPPTLGEQVVLLSPSGELRGAVVLCAVNSNAHPALSDDPNLTRLRLPDGAAAAKRSHRHERHESHHRRAAIRRRAYSSERR
ncbi:phage baseplate assembly protein V [Larsenimonas rhizosphaerae]|uniref:phage baseplate assembly protein V n=1 Tax=Larsenimonas rhizosphaerae TaxID=2944682 RepID=UPI0038993872